MTDDAALEASSEDGSDAAWVDAALRGDRAALSALVRRHQDWIFELSLRMTGKPDEAADLTQEVLIKIVTRLHSFRQGATFRTWAHRIAVHHFLDDRRAIHRRPVVSFQGLAERINACPDEVPVDSQPSPEEALVLAETKASCLFGMLLCLDARQRMALALGSFLGLDGEAGARAMGTSAANFRQLLSRARRDLALFMQGQCGLVDPANPCRCRAKTRAFIERGVVDPVGRRFTAARLQAVRAEVEADAEAAWLRVQRSAGRPRSPDFGAVVQDLLS